MKWLSRKLAVVTGGSGLFAILPVAFKHFGVSDPVAITALAGITGLTGYYLKMNKDSKVLDGTVSGQS